MGLAELISGCLVRHGLPATPGDIGMSSAEFARAVTFGPETRPGRYTILGIEDGWKAEWSSSEFLRKFLAGGQVVEVGNDAKVKVNVTVQKNTSTPD